MVLRALRHLALLVTVSTCLASVRPVGSFPATVPALSTLDLQVHASSHLPSEDRVASGAVDCAVSKPPQPLATPDPMPDAGDFDGKLAVSFIIGTDGRVHSPVILESIGTVDEHSVLATLRSWRYRPALCNAEPEETESNVEFSSH